MMTDTTHTPGPWAVDRWTSQKHGKDDLTIIQKDGDLWVAGIIDGVEFADGNAALIAAAPELLAIARHFESLADTLESEGFIGDGDVIAIRAAIAKARGE